nr:hypothetical protein [Paenibacillus dendrobii]
MPHGRDLTRQDLLTDAFRMTAEGRIAMYYAPHNEWINDSAKVVILGITPGWTQMKIAFQAVRDGLDEGCTDEEVLRRAKREAGFAGTMRQHLIGMLDCLGLQNELCIESSADLFGERASLLHTTSLLKYPVFAGERNYTGANPDILASALLRGQALSSLEELKELPDALLIPLGKAVERVLRWLADQGHFAGQRVLWGFPHPSGANGHRQRQFEENKEKMQTIFTEFFRER